MAKMSSIEENLFKMFMHDEIANEIKNKYVLQWNFRSLPELPIELLYFGKHLEELYLKWNNLMALPTWIDHLTALTSLHLFGNKISHLPINIGSLKLLSVLEVQNNLLESLPSSIGDLKNLTVLNLQFNKISELPPEIINMKALAVLNLKGNKLRRLPFRISKLHSLQELVLDNNILKELPLDIVYLPNVTYISVDGNLLSYLPFLRFINNPIVSFTNNPEISYLSYEVGHKFSANSVTICSHHEREGLWYFELVGCSLVKPKPENWKNRLILYVPSFDRNIILPEVVRKVTHHAEIFVPTLLELTLRSFYDLCFLTIDTRKCIYPELMEHLPQTLNSLLWNGPVAICHHCNMPLFLECVLWLIPRFIFSLGNNSSKKIIAAIFFCSNNCSREYSLYENLSITITDKLGFSLLPWYILSRS